MSIMANAVCQNGQMSILVDKRSRWFSPTGWGRAAAPVDKTAQSGQRKNLLCNPDQLAKRMQLN
ncbi:hypothetical protein SAMN05444172_2538 [Burkholderia sp. GAS332]|jgi:hypothetical protein|nr:hypothetical protein SAMN05444172_2538 [Burkholderia sp. GAS332]